MHLKPRQFQLVRWEGKKAASKTQEDVELLAGKFMGFSSAITSGGEVTGQVNKNSNSKTKGQ